jgi:hypothetical protein
MQRLKTPECSLCHGAWREAPPRASLLRHKGGETMKAIAYWGLGAALMLAGPAAAEDTSSIDLTKLTCAQFAATKAESKFAVMTWLEGRYAKADDHVIDFLKLTGDLTQVLFYCGDNPTADMITAADRVLGKGKD